MCESPAMEFGEGDAQVRPLHHGQVRRVAAVKHVNHPHLVKDPSQHRPKWFIILWDESPSTIQVENKTWQEC